MAEIEAEEQTEDAVKQGRVAEEAKAWQGTGAEAQNAFWRT